MAGHRLAAPPPRRPVLYCTMTGGSLAQNLYGAAGSIARGTALLPASPNRTGRPSTTRGQMREPAEQEPDSSAGVKCPAFNPVLCPARAVSLSSGLQGGKVCPLIVADFMRAQFWRLQSHSLSTAARYRPYRLAACKNTALGQDGVPLGSPTRAARAGLTKRRR